MNVITAPLNPANLENLVNPAPNPAFRWGRLKLLTSLVLLLCLKSIGITPVARSQDFTYAGESVEAREIIITAIDEDMNTRVPARASGDALGLADAVSGAAARASVFEVTYIGFTPEAQTAFQHAVDIASNLITSPVTIRVQSKLRTFSNPKTLAGARANSVYPLPSLAWSERFWYPDALADKLLPHNLSPGTFDILTSFSNRADLPYFCLDQNPPSGKYVVMTIALHELVHQLGFAGQGFPTYLSRKSCKSCKSCSASQLTRDLPLHCR